MIKLALAYPLRFQERQESLWLKNFRDGLDRQKLQVELAHSGSRIRPANIAYNARLQKRLEDQPDAMKWLIKTRGYSPEIIKYFRLGLTEAYVPKGQSEPLTENALAAPLLDRTGQFLGKYVNYAIPGVTEDNRDPPRKAWSAGVPRAYYSCKVTDAYTALFVCDGPKDMWAICTAIAGTELSKRLLIVTSTNGGGAFPQEWRSPGFWDSWGCVYLGHDCDVPHPKTGKSAGDEHAKAIARLSYREMRRVWPVGHKDWNDFFLAGKSAMDFERLLLESFPLDLRALEEADVNKGLGYNAANPVSIAGTFHGGYLYEVVTLLYAELDMDSSQRVERYRTVVIRSDRTQHVATDMPAPKGTPAHQIVKRLWPDGTLIDAEPKASLYATWKWSSIQDYLNGRSKVQNLSNLVWRIRQHLAATVWLPFDDDFMLLACAIAASYVQSTFDAVPLILVTGARDSGKSQLGNAISEVACNSPPPVGQVSAATIARIIDMTRGFMVMDDLESIANKSNGDAQFDDLIQNLKLSYKKTTATKYVTNMKTGKVEKLNFFGMKLINNTQGVDSILGSRMFTITTRAMPEGTSLSQEKRLTPDERDELRNDLHTWAFCEVGKVVQMYAMIFPNRSTRSEEISAPLRVIAELSGDKEIQSALQRVFERQVKLDAKPETAEDILHEALESILEDGVVKWGQVRAAVCVTEVIMRMSLFADRNFGKSRTTDLSYIESPEWVGRQLRQRYAEPRSPPLRIRLYGKFLRGCQLSDEFVEKTLTKSGLLEAKTSRSVELRDFCKRCAGCEYAGICEMRAERVKTEKLE
ncbi:MAG: hypothetical protein B7Y28_22730 [Polaromonas sp. 16-63-31]|nr:MAG: hypothetical protein B7Y60_23240 [Polaromonas sp. 35-63-35]OYZ15035.1 MAG: hypothetical protein B7Y28_22730 [Polaromonas sp. 16-63-31]OZA45840.1 MAG: hypothetical protein B7X88_24020 [Polaromonas sp. 17-63-33]